MPTGFAVLFSRAVSARRSRTLLVLLTIAAACLCPATPARAADSPQTLSAAQELAIARAFAPTLVFHPDEVYFPTSAMRADARESWAARVDQYRGLSMTDKLTRAVLAYRVFPYVDGANMTVVVEYWCYYVFNAYAIRGAWLPYKMPDNHPHDLERLFFVLRPTANAWRSDLNAGVEWARSAFQITRVVANAHDGAIPPNEYTVPFAHQLAAPVDILVERGSHAMAPDINGDGRFKPGVDSTPHAKAVWGIRDNGSTWRGYSASFMDPRGPSAIRLCGPATPVEDGEPACSPYGLSPADDLQRWYEDLQLTGRERGDLLGRTPWLIRAFGDLRVEELVAPTDVADGRAVDRLARRRQISETGFVAGFTTVDHAPTLVLSRRFFWEVPSARAPDLLIEGVALFPAKRRTMFESTIWASYKIDAITNALVGVGYFTERHTASLILGAEIRLGRLRVRPNWRIADNGFDARVTMTFR